jgi:hypothetical protein
MEDKIKEYIMYNAETGELSWKRSYREKRKGEVIANKCRGYIRFSFMRKVYQGHRVAWLLQFGKWPDQVIDHIDGNTSNNRILNLRDVSLKENFQGFRKLSPRNKTGVTGVTWSEKKKCYTATKTMNGIPKFLGCFDSIGEAAEAYSKANDLPPANPKTYRTRRKDKRLRASKHQRFLPNGTANPEYNPTNFDKTDKSK